MKVKSSSIQQIDKRRSDGSPKPKSECRKWRLWANTDHGRKSKRFSGTYTQAQEALRAFEEELGGFVPNSDTFGPYAESWRLWRAGLGRYSPNTLSEDARKVRALRRTSLDGMRMDEVTPEACRDALMWLKSHPEKGGTYSNTTMATFHLCLRAIMQQAVDDGKLSRNPMEKLKAPKPDTKEREALSPMEIELFLNRVDEMPLDGKAMALYLMACLGLRVGEACAIMDSDVSGGYANVRLTAKGHGAEPGPTKTESGARRLPMPPRLSAKVAQWREARKALGFADVPELCCNSRGKPMETRLIQNWWANIRSGIGCDGMVLHQLRHSNLSMMARHMSAFDLQRWAGWSTIAPARIYIHDDEDALKSAIESAWGSIERTKSAPLAG